jgi:hypothetical protein
MMLRNGSGHELRRRVFRGAVRIEASGAPQATLEPERTCLGALSERAV